MATDNNESGKRLLRYGEVAEKLGYSPGTVRNKVSSGELPFTPIKLNDHTVRFRESEVDRWIEERAAASASS